jgi:excisionase family DNA binding protein
LKGFPALSQLVSIAVAAEHLGVSILTVRRWISQGKITGYRVGSRLIRVDVRELDQLARPIPIVRKTRDAS